MGPHSYRQPNPGQPLVPLIEGEHGPGIPLNVFAGQYNVVCCFGSRSIAEGAVALASVKARTTVFDSVRVNFMGVTINPGEPIESASPPGITYYFDIDGGLSRLCGSLPLDAKKGAVLYRVTWTVLDPGLRVIRQFVTAERADCDAVLDYVATLTDPGGNGELAAPAPILVFPRLFEPSFCEKLIALYQAGETRDSGYMVDNVERFDHQFKRRRDYFLSDDGLMKETVTRFRQCIIPEIRKLYFMEITRMERYLVACYSADEDGHFGPHRDNGQLITAHRRFALTVALNDDFDGGELMFPEYNRRGHKTPRGWAILFPCAALHAVSKVTRGKRYVFLPFFFDEEGARIKERAERALLGGGGKPDARPSVRLT